MCEYYGPSLLYLNKRIHIVEISFELATNANANKDRKLNVL